MTRIGEPWRPGAAQERWDAIVIGSGIGGLAAAALLARHGKRRVLVLERHYTAGGFTHVFRRPGYEWDVGVHYIGDVAPGRHAPPNLRRRDRRRARVGRHGRRLRPRRHGWRASTSSRAAAPRSRPSSAAASRTSAMRSTATSRSSWRRSTSCRPSSRRRPCRRCSHRSRGPWRRGASPELAARTTREVLESLTAGPAADRRPHGAVGRLRLAAGGEQLRDPRARGPALLRRRRLIRSAARPASRRRSCRSSRRAAGACSSTPRSRRSSSRDGRAVGVRMAETGEVIPRAARRERRRASSTPSAACSRPSCPPIAAIRADLRTAPPSTAHVALYVGLRGTARELGLPRANLWVHPDEHHERAVAAAAAAPLAPRFAYISFPSAKDPDFERRCPGRATIEVAAFVPWAAFAQLARHALAQAGRRLRCGQGASRGAPARLLDAHVPAGARPRRACRALDAAQHPPLRRPSARRDLRPRPRPGALPPRLAAAAHARARALSHRRRRRDRRRRRRAHGRRHVRLGDPAPQHGAGRRSRVSCPPRRVNRSGTDRVEE